MEHIMRQDVSTNIILTTVIWKRNWRKEHWFKNYI